MEKLKDWVLQEIEQIAAIGKMDRGITRLAYTTQDAQAREYVIGLMEKMGLSIRLDQAGNVIGRLEGKEPTAPVVATGSHLDTVPEAGKYDGVVGVVGGLAAIQELKKRGPLTHPVEVIIFTGEESSRFGFATIGSKAMAGLSNVQGWKKARDLNGTFLFDAVAEQKLSLEKFPLAARAENTIKAFIELHIEQSGLLDKGGQALGIVEKVAAPTRFKITVEGVASHSGTTLMEDRQDALVSAAMVILAIQEIALEQADRGTVATVGAMKVHPGAMNVVPGMVEMWVDVRGLQHDSVIECLQEIKDEISTIADEQETSVSIEMIVSEKPVVMSEKIIELLESCAEKKNFTYLRMDSGAGHDAMNMSRIAPAGLIFIPSKGGVSHRAEEYTSLEDIMNGIEVLTDALYELAK